MPYEFFFSYTRANNDAYLKTLFADLSQAIRDIRGEPPDAEVGFFDQRELELGEEWDAAIINALQTSKVFIAVTSPAYFKSDYCGKEWRVFHNRISAGRAPVPPLLKPIAWIPTELDTLASPLLKGQMTFGDPGALQNQRGFKHILKNLQDHTTTYNNLIEELAREITTAGDAQSIGPLGNVPSLALTPSAFAADAATGAGPALVAPTGPKHVRFVYVAADPNLFGDARGKDPYLHIGGADWKPFFPADTTRIHRFAQHVASSDELDFTSEELRFGENLVDEIVASWSRRQIVVLIIDGWSLHWNHQYQNILKRLDERLDFHWCVLVPRNDQDPDSAAIKDHIDAALRTTFDRHINFAPNPLFFRDNITSAVDLRMQLGEVLTKLKEEIRKRADVAMPVPVGPSKAVVSSASGGN